MCSDQWVPSTPFLTSLYPSFTLRTISDISCSDELKGAVFAQSLGTNRGQAATPRMSLTLQNLFHSRRFSFRCLRRSQEAVRQRRAPLVNTWSENPCCTNCLRLLAIFLRDVEGRQKPQIFQSSDSDEKERNNYVFRVKNNWEMFNISKPS